MKKIIPLFFVIFSCTTPYYAPIITPKPLPKKRIVDTINCDTIHEGVHILLINKP
jgi:hypothetical protein